jgi:hypothetical protein
MQFDDRLLPGAEQQQLLLCSRLLNWKLGEIRFIHVRGQQGTERLHSEEFHDLYVRVMNSRGMRWAGHVVCMAERRYAYRLPREISRLENVGVARRIILKWTFKKSDGSMDSIRLLQDKGGLL